MRPSDYAEVALLLRMQGCGDHGCRYVRSVGMGTNGGCRCDLPAAIRAALTRTGQDLPPADVWPLGIECSKCQAEVGKPCTVAPEVHTDRWVAAINSVRRGWV